MRCPCCGSEVVSLGRALTLNLSQNRLYRDGQYVALQPSDVLLLSLLFRNHPTPTTHTEIERALRPGQDVPTNWCCVRMCTLRKTLKPLGLGLRNFSARGYVLTLDTRRLGEEAANHHVSSLKTGPRSIESRAVLSA